MCPYQYIKDGEVVAGVAKLRWEGQGHWGCGQQYGRLVQWYDSCLGYRRSRVQFPDRPFLQIIVVLEWKGGGSIHFLLDFELLVVAVAAVQGQQVLALQHPEGFVHLGQTHLVRVAVVSRELSEEVLHRVRLQVLGEVGPQEVAGLFCDLADSHLGGCGSSCCDDVHVDQAGDWVGGCLLGGYFDEVGGFVDVLGSDFVAELHLGEGFAKADQGFQLAGSGSDDLLVVAELPHLGVSVAELATCSLGEERMDVFPCVGDVLCQSVLPIRSSPKQSKIYVCLCGSELEKRSKMCEASRLSLSSLGRSSMMQMRSKRDSRAGVRLMFSTTDFLGSQRECTGLAAARMAALEFRLHTMPAFAIEMVCCSIASSRMVRLFWSILSNSSMQQIPRSLSTNAPLSRMNSRVSGSLRTLAVRPTALDPLPLVQIPRGAILQTCWRSWDLAVEGSPTRQMLTSDRNLPLPISPNSFLVPPKSWASMPFLMSSWPQMLGAKLATSSLRMVGELAILANSRFSSSVKTECAESERKRFSSRMRKEMRSMQVLKTDLRLVLARCSLTDCARQIPTTSTRSPGRMPSTLLSQQMMVREWGVSPSGTYSGSSWNFTYCLSVNWQRLCISCRVFLCLQFRHSVGSCTFAFSRNTLMSSPQLPHRNKALFISGQTSLVLMTIPLKQMSRLMLRGPKFLTSVSSSRCLMPIIRRSLLANLSAFSVWL